MDSRPAEINEPVLIPIKKVPVNENVQMDNVGGLVTLVATGAELKSVLRMIADHHRLNLVLAPDVGGPVTVSIRGAQMEEVLDAILGVAGFSWHRVGNLLYVTGESMPGIDPRVQGRTLRVYPLDYVAAAEVESVANGLLSPVGSAFISESDSADQLKTRELLIVEDAPAGHHRIEQYIAQVDVPPKQVLVEAHILQVALSGEERHGIDLRALARFKGAEITLEGSNFAREDPSGSSVAFRIEGEELNSLIECIREQTNSRTLASPKLSVVNHQEAKLQIGQRLPYSVATTTQTSTIESVEFLEVGVVLTVRPVVTDDGHVLMMVLPKVSGGKITENGFPEEDTTEVSTTVLLPDGGGLIIGGMIREDNVDSKAMTPVLGRIPLVGRLFRRRSSECRRNELIVALVTHIMPDAYGPRHHEVIELEQTLPPYASSELHQPLMIPCP
jgi:type II secretory pathway component GspD/PulD (secretin)